MAMVAFSSAGVVSAQSMTPEVIGAAGTHASGTNVQMSWTVGELSTETFAGSGQQLSQGFHQTLLTVTALETALPEADIQVFPNPVSETLRARWTQPDQSFYFVLMDMSGKVLLQKEVAGSLETEFNLTGFPSGNYILQTRSESGTIGKNFKVQIVR